MSFSSPFFRKPALIRTLLLGIILFLALAGTFYYTRRINENLSPPYAGALAAHKEYGVTLDLTQYDEAALAGTLAELRENGLVWLRQPVSWAEIEPAPGHYRWAALDRVFAALHSHHEALEADLPPFKLILVLQTTPTWARPSHTSVTAPPLEMREFGRFARTLAGRYGEGVDYYQIWDEPNLSRNWGNAFVDPGQYTGMLQEAALNLREADPEAYVLTAALAPTLESGPLNLNEMTYLDQLYGAGAAPWFDIVAGQPYGFDFDPADPARFDRLNFRRLELLRQVMLRHGDAAKPIWATAFGWNILPLDWAGQPPPWRSDQNRLDPPEVQLERTAAALQQARQAWPWLGPMLAIHWDSSRLSATDPARGFALAENPPLLALLRQVAEQAWLATPAAYPATHPSGTYSPGWRFAPGYADIPQEGPRSLLIAFEGERLDLQIRRGAYRGYLWVTVDGQPANALPQDSLGRSYILLYDPLRGQDRVTLAQNLGPGLHQALIEAEGGWGQWTIAGWVVYNEADPQPFQIRLLVSLVLAALSGFGLSWTLLPALVPLFRRIWQKVQLLAHRYLNLADSLQIFITFTLALAFYFTPGWPALALLLPLALSLLLRPDLGLTLIALSLSFFLATKPLPLGLFWPLETFLFLTTIGFILREIPHLSNLKSKIRAEGPLWENLKSLDLAALALLLLALAATLAAPNFGVSMFEWRMLVAESVLFYFLVRLGRDYGPAAANKPRRWAWRLVDALVAGAVLHAGLALWLYFFTSQTIMAEGVRRALGPIYSSPNNLALFLDRVWPVLLAVTFFSHEAALMSKTDPWRRWGYGLGLVIVSLVLYLTFSKGALLVGIPVAVVLMTFLYLRASPRRWSGRTIGLTAAFLLLLSLALIPLSQTPRLRTLFDFNPGSTGFFRLKLWQAALQMLGDHWLLGVGLNNFLYQYRTRYILPEAWQEPNLSHPHNLILDFGTRLGLGGIMILGWLQFSFWRQAWWLYRQQPEAMMLGLMGSMAVFISHGLVDNSYFLVDLAFAFFLAVGIVQALSEE